MTRARVESETRGKPRMARETVAVDTPARWATSMMLLLGTIVAGTANLARSMQALACRPQACATACGNRSGAV